MSNYFIDFMICDFMEFLKEQNQDFELQKKSIRKRIDKIDKTLKSAFESGMGQFSDSLKKNIE